MDPQTLPAAEQTPDCKVDICTQCGVCDFKVIKNVLAPKVSEETWPEVPKETAEELPLRYTVRYSRRGNLRFLGHLELASAIKRNIKRAGLPSELSIHSGRHTMAVHLLKKTSNLRLVQKQLGHASPATTANMYADISFEDMQEGVTGLYEQ